MKKKIMAMSLITTTLVLSPLLVGDSISQSSSGPLQNDVNNQSAKDVLPLPDEYRVPITQAGPGTGVISKSIYEDYKVGSAYPTSRYYVEYHPTFGKMAGTCYFSDIYPIGNGYVRVWYHGQLSRA